MSMSSYDPTPWRRLGSPPPATGPRGIPANWKVRDRFAWFPRVLWKLDVVAYFTVRAPAWKWLCTYCEVTFPSGQVRGIYGTCS